MPHRDQRLGPEATRTPAGSKPLRTRDFERILIVKLSHLGDVVHAVPVLAKLRARYPAARIDWLVTAENAGILRGHPALSEIVPFRRRDLVRFGRSRTATAGLLGLLRTLRRNRYDLVIDLQGQVRSALLTRATGAPVRLGFAVTREATWGAYTHRVAVPTSVRHAVDRYLAIGPALGFDDAPPDFTLPLPPAAEAGCQRLLAECGLAGRPYALLVPGATWETKHWPAERFAIIGRDLLASGLGVVLAGAPGDAARCRAVAAACPGAHDLSGRTSVDELAALIRRASICVTHDSGPMHLAAALDRPVVAVFGPTDPGRHGPYGHPGAVVRADVPCAPCYLRQLDRCRYGHRCMEEVPAAAVLDRLRAALAEPPRPGAEAPARRSRGAA